MAIVLDAGERERSRDPEPRRERSRLLDRRPRERDLERFPRSEPGDLRFGDADGLRYLRCPFSRSRETLLSLISFC